jgi:hypothetical protein
VGTPLSCNTPPPRACADAYNLRIHDSQGTCVSGKCQYTSREVRCSGGCKAGQCVGSPCTGVKCDNPPGPCHQNPGTCAGGKCSYPPLAAGTPCTPKDRCVTGASCDGKGTCVGTKINCARPHTSGGTCVGGSCQGFRCDAGWGNCNTGWSDGCETPLNSSSNCGRCGNRCGGAANATPACSGGTCVLQCRPPWRDCDGRYSNGCEIPVGVANRCNKDGLTNASGPPIGCGTAHCGSSSTSYAQNFGSWTCTFCSHCHLFSGGYAWCLFGSGRKGNFSTDRCASCCNASLADKVCPK